LKNLNRITEGAILLALYTIIFFVTYYFPFLAIVTSFLLAIPAIYYASKYSIQDSILFFIVSMLLTFIFGILAIAYAVSFVFIGLIIGFMIQKQRPYGELFFTSTILFLISTLFQYAIAVIFFKFDFYKEMFEIIDSSLNQVTQILSTSGQFTEQDLVILFESFNQSIIQIELLLPTIIVIVSVISTSMLFSINFPILRRLGLSIQRSIPFYQWRLPISLLWLYVTFVVLQLILGNEDSQFIKQAFANLDFIFIILFSIQGFSFIAFLTFSKKLWKGLPVVAMIGAIIVPILFIVAFFLGILDIALRLRDRLNSSK